MELWLTLQRKEFTLNSAGRRKHLGEVCSQTNVPQVTKGSTAHLNPGSTGLLTNMATGKRLLL